MAIQFTKIPRVMTPAYSKNILEAYDSNLLNAVTYYKIYIQTSLGTTELEIEPNIENKISIDVSPILQSYLSSSISILDSSTLSEYINMITYTLKVEGYNVSNTLMSTGISDTLRVFNGSDTDYNLFDLNDYVATSANDYKKWMNKISGGIDVHFNDDLSLQVVIGSGSYNGLKIRVHQNDGTVLADKLIGGALLTYLANINIGVPYLVSHGVLIDANTDYYEVIDVGGYHETVRVNIIEDDPRSQSYRLAYVNRLGATDYINFDKPSIEILNIDKSTFTNNGSTQIYNVEASDTLTLQSGYMSENKANDLLDLWTSPCVKMYINDDWHSVILSNSKQIIYNRRNKKLINYSATLKFADEFRVIQQ